jgi:hypothetical protein
MTHSLHTDSSTNMEETTPLEAKLKVCYGVRSETIQEILHKSGYQAQVLETENYTHIQSANNGTVFFVALSHLCETTNQHRKMSIYAIYESDLDRSVTSKKANAFNASIAYLKCYVEGEDRIRIQVDWIIGKGVTASQIAEWLQLWRAGMAIFEAFWVAEEV